MADHDQWQHLEAEFARQMAEAPKPKGPEPVFVRATDGTYYAFEKARERGEYGEAPKPQDPTLPYDYARCHGRDWPECADCLRRLAPDRPNGWQAYMVPPERKPHPAWVCESRIAGEARET